MRLDYDVQQDFKQAALRHEASNVLGFSRFLLLLTGVVLLWSAAASAQLAGKGEIKGQITDTSGAVVPGATVTATSTTQGTKFTRTTSNAGEFDLSPLDAGIYTVTVTGKGFQTLTQENVHVNSLEVEELSSP